MKLLDTDTLSLLFAAHTRTSERFDKETEVVGTTLVTRLEMLLGRIASILKAEDGAKLLQAQHRLQQTEANLTTLAIIPFDANAASEFEKIQVNKKLKKIGRNDLLIASIALAQGATLVTRNLRHFQQVPGLRLENWAD